MVALNLANAPLSGISAHNAQKSYPLVSDLGQEARLALAAFRFDADNPTNAWDPSRFEKCSDGAGGCLVGFGGE